MQGKHLDWIIAKLVCKRCGRVYEVSSYKTSTMRCHCGGELEVVWDYASNWRVKVEGRYIRRKDNP